MADADRISGEEEGTGLSDGEQEGKRERDPISESSEFSHSHRDESTRNKNELENITYGAARRWQETTTGEGAELF